MSGLTLLPFDPLLDLPPWVGQRQATFRFDMTNGLTGQNLGTIHPLVGASLTHDTQRTIKRQLTMDLGVYDTATINPITARIKPWMVFPNGREFPLGTFMFTDTSHDVFTSGDLSAVALNDEMFLVDQQIPNGISGQNNGTSVNVLITKALDNLPIRYTMEASTFRSTESWAMGAMRGQVLESLALSGGFFSPWFGNDSRLHFIKSFNPADRIPDFDYDGGNQVFRAGIRRATNLLTAPNKFVVVANQSSSTLRAPIVGEASVPQNAPHSEANRGFQMLQVTDMQASDAGQAQAIANNLVNRQTIFETVTLTTAPDPRHDAYNVVRWQGDLWLELSWSMALTEGGGMNHFMRRAYDND